MRSLALAVLVAGAAETVRAAQVVYTPPNYACQTANTTNLPFCNPKLPLEERIADLLSRLTVAEKIGLLGSANGACRGGNAIRRRARMPPTRHGESTGRSKGRTGHVSGAGWCGGEE
jgi:hypothetical protein